MTADACCLAIEDNVRIFVSCIDKSYKGGPSLHLLLIWGTVAL